MIPIKVRAVIFKSLGDVKPNLIINLSSSTKDIENSINTFLNKNSMDTQFNINSVSTILSWIDDFTQRDHSYYINSDINIIIQFNDKYKIDIDILNNTANKIVYLALGNNKKLVRLDDFLSMLKMTDEFNEDLIGKYYILSNCRISYNNIDINILVNK